jgi:hypothetical protein
MALLFSPCYGENAVGVAICKRNCWKAQAKQLEAVTAPLEENVVSLSLSLRTAIAT